MKLPGAAAYMEALQDPATCFADPELAAAGPALGPLGLPLAVSGNVAVVFRLHGADDRIWAVRCFVRPVDGQRARYDAIRAHLGGLSSTWPVGFDHQPCGIRVDGDWWPIVKMDWAPGEALLAHVRRNLWDRAALASLAARFAALVYRLRAEGVAHGDLQHGNILVAPGGDLRLVDYDGMYVPALAGMAGTERGHRNYQHPAREVGDYGPALDSFSAWVIYASLAALAADPLLWGRLDGGDEALLLRQHDLLEPDRSAALAAMEASSGDGVSALGGLLRSFLAVSPGDVPPLAAALAPPLPGPAVPVGVRRADGAARAGTPAAIETTGAAAPPCPAGAGRDQRPASPPQLASDGPGPGGSDGPGPGGSEADGDLRRSLFDALTSAPVDTGQAGGRVTSAGRRPPPLAGRDDLHEPRAILAAGGATVVVLAVVALVTGTAPLLVGGVALAVAGAALARAHRLFVLSPAAQAARLAGATLTGPRRAVDEAVAAVDRLTRRRADVAATEAAAAAQAARARDGLRAAEEAELRAMDGELDAALTAVAERERRIATAEQEARAAALAELQGAVIDAQLAQHSLVMAATCGVSDTVVHRLAMDGVRTAADFTDVVVEKAGAVVVRRDGRRIGVSGMDQHQVAGLLAWRRRVAGVAQLKVPGNLPPDRLATVRAHHDAMRVALAGEAARARSEAKIRADQVRTRWQAEHEQVVQRQKQVETDAARQRVELDRDLVRARKDVAEAEWLLGRHQQETGHVPTPSFAAYLSQVLAVGPLAGAAGRPGRPRAHGEARRPPPAGQ